MRIKSAHITRRNAMRRLRRDESGHAPGPGMGGGSFTPPNVTPAPTPAPTPNNTGGNSTPPAGESGADNNGGQTFDPSAFWNSPPEGNGAPPARESAGSQESSGGQQPPPNPTNQIVESLGKLDFGKSVMTDQAIKDLAEGNTDSFHTGMNQFGQQVATQTLGLAARLMTQVRDDLRREIQETMNGTLTQRDNEADLLKSIPSASNPAIKKIVDPIFAQALKVTKGDRAAAIVMTKSMLQFQSQQMDSDLGLPPRSAGDQDALVPSNVNWLEELSGR